MFGTPPGVIRCRTLVSYSKENSMDEQSQLATKADIAEIDQKIELLRSEMNHQYRDVVERIADSQTELLKAFYGYAQGNNKRVAEL